MDRIIVKTDEDKWAIRDWAFHFTSSLPPDERIVFLPPFKKGEVVLAEEKTRIFFEYLSGGETQLKVYIPQYQGVFVKYKFNYSTLMVYDEHYHKNASPKLAEEYFKQHGNINLEYGLLWFCLMLMAVYYRPEFERKQRVTGEKTRGKKKTGKSKPSAKTLYSKNYIIDTDTVVRLPRTHRKPSCEFGVKGHYRHYKSGKVVWIEPHKRCVGRGKQKDSDYIAKVEPDGAGS